MAVAPVTPLSIRSLVVDVDNHVTKINAFLSRPWSDYDRGIGRWYNIGGVDAGEREAIHRVFAAAGWLVQYVDDQRDGAAFVFRMAAA
jgi:hypothetical protein